MDISSRLDAEHLAVYEALPDDFLAGLDDIAGVRARMQALMAAVPRPPWPPDITIDDRLVPGPDGAPDVLVRLYRPAELTEPAGALLHIHGGGMVLGDVSMTDDACAAVADEVGILVASVDYRLAPEHPFPAPLEDCYAALLWLSRTAGELEVDPERIAVGGGSAGGGLAAGLALLARDRGEVPVAFQLLVYPMLDDRNATPSSSDINDTRVWNRAANVYGWNAYLTGRAGADDVPGYAAPARAVDLAGLPPAYVNVGDLDLFVDEDIAYATALRRAGVPVELHVYPGAFHGSNGFAAASALSQRWTRDERDALRRGLLGR